MNKEQQIKEIEKVLQDEQLRISNTADGFKQLMKEGVCKCHAEALYNAGYRKVPDGEVTLSPEERDFVMKTITDIRAERDELKAENERLSEKLKQVLLSIDTVKEMNTMCNIDAHRKQAVKEFAEKLKGKLQDFGDGGEKGAYITKKDIDELLKEYDSGK